MFAGQNGPVADTWFQPSRFTELFRTAAATIPGSGRQTWDSQMALLRSPEGERYAQALFEKFEAARKKAGRGLSRRSGIELAFPMAKVNYEPMLVSYVDISVLGNS